MIIPVGTSVPKLMVLVIVSASNIIIAATSDAQTSSSLWFGPTNLLAMWGAIIPMKKKFPPKATLAEDRATATNVSFINWDLTGSPSPVAV